MQEKKETVLEGSNSYSGEGPEEMVKLKEEIMVRNSKLNLSWCRQIPTHEYSFASSNAR